jgi:hypothetical protein
MAIAEFDFIDLLSYLFLLSYVVLCLYIGVFCFRTLLNAKRPGSGEPGLGFTADSSVAYLPVILCKIRRENFYGKIGALVIPPLRQKQVRRKDGAPSGLLVRAKGKSKNNCRSFDSATLRSG